jgi:hypothetical protein
MTEEELLNKLRDLADRLGKSPTARDCEADGMMPSIARYKSTFGSWNKAKEAAGLVILKKRVIRTDTQLINELAKLAKDLNRTPTTRELEPNNLANLGVYTKRFGSWDKALELAGLNKDNYSKFRGASDEELLDALVDLQNSIGREPTAQDCTSTPGVPDPTTYRARFGSFLEAKKLAGLDTYNKFSRKTNEELIATLQAFYNKEGRPPKQSECRVQNGLAGPNTYKDRFGSWEDALEAAGLLKAALRENQLSDEELLASLLKFYTETGRAPRHEDCNNINEYTYLKSHMVYHRRFKSLTNALLLAGVPLNNSSASILEMDFVKELQSIYSGDIILGDRNILQGLELDIYIPEHKLAIEVNGLYWHSDVFKDKNYHIKKTKLAEEAGVRLIHLFESEIVYKKELVLKRLRHILNQTKSKVYARDCVVKIIDSSTSEIFMVNNHIQGHSVASVRLGLYNKDNQLVAVMTFAKPRFSTSYEWELVRYATSKVVVGGASKLFSYFKKNFDPSSVITYSDIRWNTGSMYEKLGFELSHISAPNYFYFKGRRLESRYKYQKHKLKDAIPNFDPDLTEYENMINNGYNRIYDCGNKVYVYTR